ncbi:hypothetical protein ACIBAC_00695 [Streptomyces sp. NPDC051362]|uniref:hypothetical protein n=1 Tax=Streptomyces sp. NPDC051362 TaxID=3365651 RepID=UPI00378C5BEF
MFTNRLRPVSALDDAVVKVHGAAHAMVPLVGETLHRQFPTGAWLVLTRPEKYDGHDHVRLHSVRGPLGETLHRFTDDGTMWEQLPAVPEDITALWSPLDPRNPCHVLELIDRVDVIAPYEIVDMLPEYALTAEEIGHQAQGGRTPLGIPLPCACRRPAGECLPCCGLSPCPVVCSECAPWQP